MSNDIVKEIFNILSHFFETYQSPVELLDFITNSLHYFSEFINIISPITYFIPKVHFNALLGLAISIINIRALIALYNLFNPFK